MKTFIFLFILLIPCKGLAFDQWTETNTKLQIGYTILHVIDWGQTLSASRSNWQHITRRGNTVLLYQDSETNPILGKKPSPDKINLYFAATLVVNPLISFALPKGWREAWQASGIAVEAFVIARNYSIGLKGSF